MQNNIFSPQWVYKKYYLGRMDVIDMNFNIESTDMFFYSHGDKYVVKVRKNGRDVVTTIDKVLDFDYDMYCIDINENYRIPSEFNEVYLYELPQKYIDEAVDTGLIPLPESEYYEMARVIYDKNIEEIVCIDAKEWGNYSLFPFQPVTPIVKAIETDDDEELDFEDEDLFDKMISRISGK